MRNEKTPILRIKRQAIKVLHKGRSLPARLIDWIMMTGITWLLLWWILGRMFGSAIWLATAVWIALQGVLWLRKRRRIDHEVEHILADARKHWLGQMQPDSNWPFRIAYACNCAITGEKYMIIWEEQEQSTLEWEFDDKLQDLRYNHWCLLYQKDAAFLLEGYIDGSHVYALVNWLQDWPAPQTGWRLWISQTETLAPEGCDIISGERLTALLDAWDSWPATPEEREQLVDYAAQLLPEDTRPGLAQLKETFFAPHKAGRYLLYGGLLQALVLTFRLRGMYPWMGAACLMLGLVCLWRGYRSKRNEWSAQVRLQPVKE